MKRNPFPFLAAALFFLFPLLLPANGGPVDGSDFFATGNIVPLRQAKVKILSEDLRIRLSGDSGFVDVLYELLNEQNNELDVTYGFPVDVRGLESGEGRWMDSLKADDFVLFFNEVQVNTSFYNEPNRERTDSIVHYDNNKRQFTEEVIFWRRWHVAKIKLPPGKKSTIRVRFKTRNGFEDWATSKSFFTGFSNRNMLYDFTPASYWGKGNAGKFYLRVDAQNIIYNGGSVFFEGLQLREKITGVFEYEGSDVNLHDLGRLSIHYDNSDIKKNDEYLKPLNVNAHIRSVKTSSVLGKNYEAKNLADGDMNTCWAEGAKGSGVNEYIDIELDSTMELYAVLFVNGYAKNEDLFYKNNRAKAVSIRSSCPAGTAEGYARTEYDNYEYADSTWHPENKKIPWASCVVAADFGDLPLCAKSLRITIKEIYRGTKYNDLCISEIYLLGRTKRKGE